MDAAGTKVVEEEKSSAQKMLAADGQIDGGVRIARVVAYHCCRRVELRWPIRLDDRLLYLRFTIALSRLFGNRMCEKQRDAESAMSVRERRKQSQVGEEKSSCKARLCSDPALDGMFHAEFGRFPFLHNRHLSLPKLAKLSSFACFAMVVSRLFVND
jgi:hypothetical protein